MGVISQPTMGAKPGVTSKEAWCKKELRLYCWERSFKVRLEEGGALLENTSLSGADMAQSKVDWWFWHSKSGETSICPLYKSEIRITKPHLIRPSPSSPVYCFQQGTDKCFWKAHEQDIKTTPPFPILCNLYLKVHCL